MNQKTAKFLRRLARRTADPTRRYAAKVKHQKARWRAKDHAERGAFRAYHQLLAFDDYLRRKSAPRG